MKSKELKTMLEFLSKKDVEITRLKSAIATREAEFVQWRLRIQELESLLDEARKVENKDLAGFLREGGAVNPTDHEALREGENQRYAAAPSRFDAYAERAAKHADDAIQAAVMIPKDALTRTVQEENRMRAIYQAAEECGAMFPAGDYWPGGLPK